MIIEITDSKDLEQVAGGAAANDRAARFAASAARFAALLAGGPGVTVSINRDADGNEIGRSFTRSGNGGNSGSGSSGGGRRGFPASAALGLPN